MDQLTPNPAPQFEYDATPGITPSPLPPPRGFSLFKKVVIAATAAALILIGIGAWWFFSASGQNLTVAIDLPERLLSGVPTELTVQMSNASGSNLKNAQVSVSLPDGIVFVGTPGSRSVEHRTVGDLTAEKLSNESFLIMATGNPNTIATVNATVSYVPGALSSRFEQRVGKEVVIGEAGIELGVAPPVKAFGNEQFVTEVSYRNSSEVTFADAELRITYPTGFTLISTSVASGTGAGPVWKLGNLAPGDEGTIAITGYVVGQDNENFEFTAALASTIGEATYEVAKRSASVGLAPSPLSIRVDVQGGPEAVYGANTNIRYGLTYTNNTAIGLRDVIVEAKLVGEMFDMKLLDTDGALRSKDSTIVWNAARVPIFANLPPGGTGKLGFTIQTKQAFPITRLSSKNYQLTVQAKIESPTVPRNVAADKTMGVATISNKLRGALVASVAGYYRDPISGIVNSGELPPKVGSPTQFTLHWILRNTSTDVQNIKLRSFLGPNVRFTGVQKSGTGIPLVYNERTQELTWEVPKISATRGILSDPVEIVFQVELTPSIDQLRSSPVLISDTAVTYTDVFTGENLTAQIPRLTTSLPDDPTVANISKGVRE